ncbi:MAG: hypothetical protein BroJett040_00550 [Oligoflexia bacterium]|nr:MAG: hypothetical protein BroJett040_00550 [Oligoflexia bacterium]
MDKQSQSTTNQMQATFSMLVMSVASSAAMSMGLAPNPQTGKVESDKNMAKFNIDLLLCLQEKTKGNLSPDEKKLIEDLLGDLQMKFLNLK